MAAYFPDSNDAEGSQRNIKAEIINIPGLSHREKKKKEITFLDEVYNCTE